MRTIVRRRRFGDKTPPDGIHKRSVFAFPAIKMKNSMKKFGLAVAAALAVGGLWLLGSTVLDSGNDGLVSSFEAEQEEPKRYENPAERLQLELEKRGMLGEHNIPTDIHARSMRFAKTLASDKDLQWAAMAKGETDKLNFMNAEWRRRGPFNIGGRTRALAIDVADEKRLLAGGVSGGLWLSEDEGASWSKRTDPIDLQSITCISQDKREGRTDTWYYGTGEFLGNSADGQGAPFTGRGLFKSDDGGSSWRQLESTVEGRVVLRDNVFDYIFNVQVDYTRPDEDIVYVAGYRGIMRSDDGGESWDLVLGDLNSGGVYTDVYLNEFGDVYAVLSSGTGGGVWRSSNGIDWTDVTPSFWPAQAQRAVIGPSPFPDEMYFFVRAFGSGVNGHTLYKFADRTGSGGQNVWDDLTENLPATGDFGTINAQGGYNMVITVHPEDDFVIYLGGRNLWRSDDGFTSSHNTVWIGGYNPQPSEDDFRYPNHHPDQHAVVFYPSNPQRMLSGNDGGVYRTEDNLADEVVWDDLNNGYFTTQFYSIAIDPVTAGDPYMLGGAQDNGSLLGSTDNAGDAWAEVLGGDGSFCAVAGGRQFYYVSSQNGELHYLKLREDGTRVQRTKINPPNVADNDYVFINPFAIDPNRPRILYLVTKWALYRNNPTDEPEGVLLKWSRLNNSGGNDGRITAVAVSTEPADRVYFGTNRHEIIRIDNADSGDPEVIDVSAGIGNLERDGYVNCIAVDPSNADNAIAVMSNYRIQSVFYTDNGGTTWTPVSGNLEENGDTQGDGPSVSWATILPTPHGTAYFVGTSIGLFATVQMEGEQTNWVLQGGDLIGNVVVDMVVSRPSDGLVAIATHGNGMYSANIGPDFFDAATSVDDIPALKQMESIQVSPSPLQTTGQFSFTLDEASPCTLEIVDQGGRTVRRLFNGTSLPAGRHSFDFDGRGGNGTQLAEGIYYLRLTAGSRRLFGKLAIVR